MRVGTARLELPELVARQIFDPLHESGAAPEAGPDLGVVRALRPPAEHATFQGPKHIALDNVGAARSREPGPFADPSNHVGATPEAASNFLLVDALCQQP